MKNTKLNGKLKEKRDTLIRLSLHKENRKDFDRLINENFTTKEELQKIFNVSRSTINRALND